jgi:hypothetical protein
MTFLLPIIDLIPSPRQVCFTGFMAPFVYVKQSSHSESMYRSTLDADFSFDPVITFENSKEIY